MASASHRVAVIGAGVAGLSCARELAGGGMTVTVFDKGSRVGGRLGTRRIEIPELSFDHGAQYFTFQDEELRSSVADWSARGVIAKWDARFVKLANGVREPAASSDRWVGVPDMHAFPLELASGLDVRTSTKVGRLLRRADCWVPLSMGHELGEFDWVVVAVPSVQASELLEPVSSRLSEWANAASMFPIWTVLVSFRDPLDVDFDAAFVQHALLAWAGRDGSKPGRDPKRNAWVLQAQRHWSERHIDAVADTVEEALIAALSEALNAPLPPYTYRTTHRWMYAQTTDWSSSGYLLSPRDGVGVCGDWCIGSRLESAIRSGRALAKRLLAEVGRAPHPVPFPEPARPEGSLLLGTGMLAPPR